MDKQAFYANARDDLRGPLDGVTVIEATTTWAGPMAGCVLAVGTSARLRGQAAWRVLDPATAAPELLAGAAKGPVAVVFGRESSGLSNEEMDRCHAILHVPVAADFKSLNLASAVQIVAYELFRHSGVAEAIPPARDAAPAEKLEGLFTHLRQVAEDTGFAPGQRADSLVRKLRRMFFRATPTDQEVDILRGLFSACQGRKSARRGGE